MFNSVNVAIQILLVRGLSGTSNNFQDLAILYDHYIALSITQTSPSYSPVCHGDNVTITCTGSGVGIAWRTSLVPGAAAVLNNVSDTDMLSTFTLTLTSKTNGIITSTATADDIQFDTFDIECSVDGVNYVLAQITVAGINSRWHTLHSNYNIVNRLYSIKFTYSSSSDGSR